MFGLLHSTAWFFSIWLCHHKKGPNEFTWHPDMDDFVTSCVSAKDFEWYREILRCYQLLSSVLYSHTVAIPDHLNASIHRSLRHHPLAIHENPSVAHNHLWIVVCWSALIFTLTPATPTPAYTQKSHGENPQTENNPNSQKEKHYESELSAQIDVRMTAHWQTDLERQKASRWFNRWRASDTSGWAWSLTGGGKEWEVLCMYYMHKY